VTQRINDPPDLGQRHAVRGLPAGPGGHRAVVGVDPPPGHQEQRRVEQLPVQLIARQAPPAARTQDIHDYFGALHYAYPKSIEYPHHLAPFALRAAFPPSLVRRDSHDYYEACVTIGLASLR
jgi:hypothetical protein